MPDKPGARTEKSVGARVKPRAINLSELNTEPVLCAPYHTAKLVHLIIVNDHLHRTFQNAASV